MKTVDLAARTWDAVELVFPEKAWFDQSLAMAAVSNLMTRFQQFFKTKWTPCLRSDLSWSIRSIHSKRCRCNSDPVTVSKKRRARKCSCQVVRRENRGLPVAHAEPCKQRCNRWFQKDQKLDPRRVITCIYQYTRTLSFLKLFSIASWLHFQKSIQSSSVPNGERKKTRLVVQRRAVCSVRNSKFQVQRLGKTSWKTQKMARQFSCFFQALEFSQDGTPLFWMIHHPG